MRFERTQGIGCPGDPSCPCMPNNGMASGFNVASTVPGVPYDLAFGAFDTSMATITFPSVAPIGQGAPLTVVATGNGNHAVMQGNAMLANGLSPAQAADVVAQNSGLSGLGQADPNAAAKNVLSGNPLQPSIVGTSDGSGIIPLVSASAATPPLSQMCSFAQSINNNPLIALAAVAGIAWLLTQSKKGRK